MLPAAWVSSELARHTAGRLSLHEVDGSIWNGSAQLVLGSDEDPDTSAPLPGRIEWQVDPSALLGGHIAVHITAAELLERPVDVAISRNEFELGAGHWQMPLAPLVALGAPFNTLKLGGHLDCHWNFWHVDSGKMSGESEIQLTDIVSSLSPVRPLGTYHVVLTGQGEQVALLLATLKGPLLIDAKGQFNESGIAIAGLAHAEPGEEERLADLLGVLGRRDANGVAFSFGTSN
jgi:general secretion pathway protein N